MSGIPPEELGSKIKEIMETWGGATESAVHLAINKTAEYAVNELHNAHPSGSGKYSSWSNYNGGWDVSSLRSGRYLSKTVYNSKSAGLTHLLERGHALANGGRAQAFPHIAPVAERCEGLLLDNIRNYMQQQ